MERSNGKEFVARTPWRQVVGGVVASAFVLGLIASMFAVTASNRAVARAWGTSTATGFAARSERTAQGGVADAAPLASVHAMR